MLPLSILYADTDLLVLNKSAGQIVNAATSHRQVSWQDYWRAQLKIPPWSNTSAPDAAATPEEIFAFRAGMVHRLDKDTSGVLLWAKNPATLAALLQQFQTHQVQKKYLALTHGLWREQEGRVSLPLARKKTNRKIMAPDPMGRPAVTEFRVLKRWLGFASDKFLAAAPSALKLPKRQDLDRLYQGFSLLEVCPRTGRTHQIRAHLTSAHHPLVGDTAYLPKNKARLDPWWCPRQFLHASELIFTHPHSGKRLTVTAPLPPDLQQVLTYLRP